MIFVCVVLLLDNFADCTVIHLNLPLVIEILVFCVSMVSISEPVPIVIVMHTTCLKLKVSACKLCALVIIICAYAHVAVAKDYFYLRFYKMDIRWGHCVMAHAIQRYMSLSLEDFHSWLKTHLHSICHRVYRHRRNDSEMAHQMAYTFKRSQTKYFLEQLCSKILRTDHLLQIKHEIGILRLFHCLEYYT